MLDKFVNVCVDVAFDDGRSQGACPENGYAVAQVKCPSFEPELVELDWKSLPASLTYEILNFPNLVSDTENRVSDFFENDWPPDFSEGFAERQYQYAKLGLRAAELATRLRRKMLLPKREIGNWDPMEHLAEVKSKIETHRAEIARRHAETMNLSTV